MELHQIRFPMLYHYVRITYIPRLHPRLRSVSCFNMPEEDVIRNVAEPYMKKTQFLFGGFVVDPRLIDKINIYETEEKIEDLRLILNRRQGDVTDFIENELTINDVLHKIENGEIGRDVTYKFITAVPGNPKSEGTDEIFKIISIIENRLRKVIRDKPTKETDIGDSLETLFIGAGLDKDFSREKESIPYSTKKYIPDFVFAALDMIVETKFCDKEGKEKNITSEINDDIVAYKTKYRNLIFVVYDMGIIRDVDKFKDSIESQESVIVKVIKH